MKKITDKLSTIFAEYILLPGYTTSEQSSEKVSLKTPLTKFSQGQSAKLNLNIPFTSAVMQAVSGAQMGISLAQEGGLAFIFSSQPIESQANMITRVKDYKAGFVVSKANLTPENTLQDALDLTQKTEYSTICITENGQSDSKLLGIITDQDYWLGHDSADLKLEQVMTPFEKITYGIEGLTLEQAQEKLRQTKKACLPIIDNETDRKLKYLVFKKDWLKHSENPNEIVDDKKRLLVGAGLNTKDYQQRVPALIHAGVDVLCIDTSDAHRDYVKDAISWIKQNYPDTPIGAGNIVTQEAFNFLAVAGADFIKVGIGGGSICITQEVKGIGRGQATALMEAAEARDKYFEQTGEYIPICSDGGLVQDSHITIALAMGADWVMMGRYFARCEQSPPEKKIMTEFGLVKPYWGEGSDRAKNWQRYSQDDSKKLAFEEGVEGWVPYAGELHDVVSKSLKVIKATMSNLGCSTIKEMHQKAVLERRSAGSIHEGKPHDIQVHSDNLGVYKQLYWGK